MPNGIACALASWTEVQIENYREDLNHEGFQKRCLDAARRRLARNYLRIPRLQHGTWRGAGDRARRRKNARRRGCGEASHVATVWLRSVTARRFTNCGGDARLKRRTGAQP